MITHGKFDIIAVTRNCLERSLVIKGNRAPMNGIMRKANTGNVVCFNSFKCLSTAFSLWTGSAIPTGSVTQHRVLEWEKIMKNCNLIFLADSQSLWRKWTWQKTQKMLKNTMGFYMNFCQYYFDVLNTFAMCQYLPYRPKTAHFILPCESYIFAHVDFATVTIYPFSFCWNLID